VKTSIQISYFLLSLLSTVVSRAQTICFRPGHASNPGAGVVEVGGFDPAQLQTWREKVPDWKNVLRIFPAALRAEKKETIPPMFGNWVLRDTLLVFAPRFPFKEGLEYVAELHNAGIVKTRAFVVPIVASPAESLVEGIFPSTDRVPANLLKWYLHFSAPMGLGDVYRHIGLLDEKGDPVEKPFLELDPPLWDKNQRRLTLWFDPGRIKKGLRPNTALGPPLLPGRRYTLLISKNLKNAFGHPLARDFEKHFFVEAEDTEKPDPARWQTVAPAAGGRDPLILRFPEAMDKAMLESGIGIGDEQGREIAGTIEVADAETRWIFTPDRPWKPGVYQILPSPRLEDLAGNNLVRLFDNPLPSGETAQNPKTHFRLPFEVLKKTGE
jgi:hypothetical protein